MFKLAFCSALLSVCIAWAAMIYDLSRDVDYSEAALLAETMPREDVE